MKNGKAPTREQKKIMKAHGLVPENWLVVKNLPDSLEVVSRVSLKKVGGKPKTRLSYNELQKGRHLLSPLPDACDHIHRAERACPYYREWMLHQTC